MTAFVTTGQGVTPPCTPEQGDRVAAREAKRIHRELERRGRENAIALGGAMRRSLGKRRRVYRGEC